MEGKEIKRYYYTYSDFLENCKLNLLNKKEKKLYEKKEDCLKDIKKCFEELLKTLGVNLEISEEELLKSDLDIYKETDDIILDFFTAGNQFKLHLYKKREQKEFVYVCQVNTI